METNFSRTLSISTNIKRDVPGVNEFQPEYIQDSTTNSYLNIDSNDREINPATGIYTQPANEFTLKSPSIMNNIYRLQTQAISFYWDIPNINPRNNTFWVNDGATSFQIVMPEGYYMTNAAITTLVQNTLNLQAPALGPWTVNLDALGRINITAAAPFKIWNSAAGVLPIDDKATDALSLCTGIALKDVFSLTHVGFRPTRLYTRYFDILSYSLTKFNRSDICTGIGAGNLLERVYLDNEFLSAAESHQRVFPFTGVSKKMRYATGADVSNIDIRLLDDSGRLLYINPTYQQFSLGIIMNVINNSTN